MIETFKDWLVFVFEFSEFKILWEIYNDVKVVYEVRFSNIY